MRIGGTNHHKKLQAAAQYAFGGTCKSRGRLQIFVANNEKLIDRHQIEFPLLFSRRVQSKKLNPVPIDQAFVFRDKSLAAYSRAYPPVACQISSTNANVEKKTRNLKLRALAPLNSVALRPSLFCCDSVALCTALFC